MTDDFAKLLAGVLELLIGLVKLDPSPDSPEGRLLIDLSAAVERFEVETFPELISRNRGPDA